MSTSFTEYVTAPRQVNSPFSYQAPGKTAASGISCPQRPRHELPINVLPLSSQGEEGYNVPHSPRGQSGQRTFCPFFLPFLEWLQPGTLKD
jgi:hypothetical protein